MSECRHKQTESSLRKYVRHHASAMRALVLHLYAESQEAYHTAIALKFFKSFHLINVVNRQDKWGKFLFCIGTPCTVIYFSYLWCYA